MGAGSFDPSAYRSFAASTRGKSTDQIYTSRDLDDSLDPKKAIPGKASPFAGQVMRESRDGTDNPNATPLIVAIDVTGSMGILADTLARKGLGTMFEEILDSKPISDPHLMFMAIGDARSDRSPLQVSQFEADNRIVEQLTKIWIEHGGGGNAGESYDLAWYFAARHTDIDSLIKRGKRGYLFTVGDEPAPPGLSPEQIKAIIGTDIEAEVSPKAILAEAQRKYDVFHIIVEEGSGGGQYGRENIRKGWVELLGERVIRLSDHTKLAETIASAILVAEGHSIDGVKTKFGGIVFDAVKQLPQGRNPKMIGSGAKANV